MHIYQHMYIHTCGWGRQRMIDAVVEDGGAGVAIATIRSTVPDGFHRRRIGFVRQCGGGWVTHVKLFKRPYCSFAADLRNNGKRAVFNTMSVYGAAFVIVSTNRDAKSYSVCWFCWRGSSERKLAISLYIDAIFEYTQSGNIRTRFRKTHTRRDSDQRDTHTLDLIVCKHYQYIPYMFLIIQ